MVTAWGARLGVGYIPGAKGSVTIFVPLSVVIWKKLCPKYCRTASDTAAYATGMTPCAISWSRQAATTGALPQAMSTKTMHTSMRIRTCSSELCALHPNGMTMIQSLRISILFRIERIVQPIAHHIEGEDCYKDSQPGPPGHPGRLAQKSLRDVQHRAPTRGGRL